MSLGISEAHAKKVEKNFSFSLSKGEGRDEG